jgi:hypothetical protein
VIKQVVLTLFRGEESQLVRAASVVGIALSIVPVLENDTETIELLHHNLNDWSNQHIFFCPSARSEYILPVCKFENRLSPLVSPPMYKNTGPPGL